MIAHKLIAYCDEGMAIQSDKQVVGLLGAVKQTAEAGNNFVVNVGTIDALSDEDWNASMTTMRDMNLFRLPYQSLVLQVDYPDCRLLIAAYEMDDEIYAQPILATG